MKNLYEIHFNGMALGGVAVIRAVNKLAAYNKLKTRWPDLEPMADLHIEKFEPIDDILYFWNGDY